MYNIIFFRLPAHIFHLFLAQRISLLSLVWALRYIERFIRISEDLLYYRGMSAQLPRTELTVELLEILLKLSP
jgi:hypothetical protein